MVLPDDLPFLAQRLHQPDATRLLREGFDLAEWANEPDNWVLRDGVGGSNISRAGGTATASSTYSGYPASNAVDGNNSSFWSSNGNRTVLGGSSTLDRPKLSAKSRSQNGAAALKRSSKVRCFTRVMGRRGSPLAQSCSRGIARRRHEISQFATDRQILR